MTKTFEVGKCYRSKENNKYYYIISNAKDYGNEENLFYCISHGLEQTVHGVYGIDDRGFHSFEECIVEDLQVGDKVLLRNGDVEFVAQRFSSGKVQLDRFTFLHNYNGRYYTELHSFDVIAILERARDKIKGLDKGRYKLPNGDIIEVE